MSARALSLMTALLMLVACGTPLAVETLAPGGTPAPDGLLKGDSNQCMRCHRMPTLAYRDQDTGEIVDLSIRADAYRHSVSAAMRTRVRQTRRLWVSSIRSSSAASMPLRSRTGSPASLAMTRTASGPSARGRRSAR
jgi:hypothetical protein